MGYEIGHCVVFKSQQSYEDYLKNPGSKLQQEARSAQAPILGHLQEGRTVVLFSTKEGLKLVTLE